MITLMIVGMIYEEKSLKIDLKTKNFIFYLYSVNNNYNLYKKNYQIIIIESHLCKLTLSSML